jgi:hypothetical protein
MNSFLLSQPALVVALGVMMPTLRAQELVFNHSGPKAALVELYSSEGCSSCPPAEAWLNHLKAAPGLWSEVFPVAFHVDYWDNLGWPDRLASASYTQRQRDYAARLGQDSVYTPEFIVNGHEWRRGFDGFEIPGQEAAMAGDLTVTVQAGDRKIAARYMAPEASAGNRLTLNVALVGFNVVTEVQRGENSGRKLEHDFVTLGFNSWPMARGGGGVFRQNAEAPACLTGETPGAIVAWVSDENGQILQVTGGWLGKADRIRN